MEFLKHNWQLKLLSIVGALLLSQFVNTQEGRIHTTILLPVTVHAPAGLRVVEPAEGFKIQVDFEGPSDLIRTLQNEDADKVTLELDVSHVMAGKRLQVPVDVNYPDKYQARGVTATWSPRSVPVLFAADTTRDFNVLPRPRSPLPDYAWTRVPKAEPPRVTVGGPAAAVSRVEHVIAVFDLSPTDIVSELATVQAVDDHGDPVADVRVDPAQVLVTGNQQRVVLQKRVPVQPTFAAPPGPRLTVSVSPPYVRITGPRDIVAEAYVVSTTPPLGLPAGSGQVTRDLEVVSPASGVTVDPARVRVTLRFGGKPGPAPRR